MKSLIKISLVSIIIAIVLIIFFVIFRFLLYNWIYSYTPSPGIWQYKDEELDIVVYVPPNGGVIASPYLVCKTEISYKGEKQKAILLYNDKMYQLKMALNDYKDIGVIPLNHVISSTYITPMKKGEWELKSIRTNANFLKDYEGRNLILKKVGKYKDPE